MTSDHLLVGELVNQHKQYVDHAEQVTTELVEGRAKDEAAESHCVRNDAKLPQVLHWGGKSSIVNLGGLRDFPHPLEFKTELLPRRETWGQTCHGQPWISDAMSSQGLECAATTSDSKFEFALQPTEESCL